MLAFKIKFSTAFIKCFENKSTTKKVKAKGKNSHSQFLKTKKYKATLTTNQPHKSGVILFIGNKTCKISL